MIPAPRIRILEPTGMGAMRSHPWDIHDKGSVRTAANIHHTVKITGDLPTYDLPHL
jgi:hypothetical protein